MLIFYVLIRIVSLVLRSPILLNIYNVYQGISLISPTYFIHGGSLYVAPDQEIDANFMMRNWLKFDSGQDILEGALIYRIQRQHAEFDKPIQDGLEDIQLLIVWRGEYKKELHVHILLVEHDKRFNWDKDKLRRLHQKYWHSLNAQIDSIGCSWLFDDMRV
jgi:hypothetical protein